jgi:hypothetical protein
MKSKSSKDLERISTEDEKVRYILRIIQTPEEYITRTLE